MIFKPPLAQAVLLRRYKRFLADVEVAAQDGARRERMTIHCANTGAMTGCAEPGSAVWYSTSANPRRKYPHTLELVRSARGHLIGVNTARANGLVAEAVAAGLLPDVAPAGPPARCLQREVPIAEALPGERGRFDLRVGETFVEVKTVTLRIAGSAVEGAFPDAVSARATRHVEALAAAARAGRGCGVGVLRAARRHPLGASSGRDRPRLRRGLARRSRQRRATARAGLPPVATRHHAARPVAGESIASPTPHIALR